MKSANSNAINELKEWLLNVDQSISINQNRYYLKAEVILTKNLIRTIADQLHKTHPFYEAQLHGITDRLFPTITPWGYTLNYCLFGQLFLIINHVSTQPQNEFWSNIHPRIINVSQSLYADDYYDSAAEKALREVETYMRELHAKFKPEKGDPKEINSIKEALLSDENLYDFDRKTQNGKNYYEGIKKLFEDAFSAYRNPASHRNISISKREAFERITLASQLMFVLENYKRTV